MMRKRQDRERTAQSIMGPTSANIGLKIPSQCEWYRPCPVHGRKDPNFAVNAETGLAQSTASAGAAGMSCRLKWKLPGWILRAPKSTGST
jgi:hypothetical protein